MLIHCTDDFMPTGSSKQEIATTLDLVQHMRIRDGEQIQLKLKSLFTLAKLLGVQWCGDAEVFLLFPLNFTSLLCWPTYLSSRLGWQVPMNTSWSWGLRQWEELAGRLEEIWVCSGLMFSQLQLPPCPSPVLAAWTQHVFILVFCVVSFLRLGSANPFSEPTTLSCGSPVLLSGWAVICWRWGQGGSEDSSRCLQQRQGVRLGGWVWRREGRGKVGSHCACFSGWCGLQVPWESEVLHLRWKRNHCIWSSPPSRAKHNTWLFNLNFGYSTFFTWARYCSPYTK